METAEAGFFSEAPVVFVTERDPTLFGPDAARHQAEKAKYEKMWGFEQYRKVAPGEDVAQVFLHQVRPPPGSWVIDFGAGTGRGALMLAVLGQCRVHMLDFASNCLDPEIKEALTTQGDYLKFTEHNLVKKCPVVSEYGFCTDVMEHIPPEDVDTVLQNILQASRHVFFQISCGDDVCGALIGEPLHLSVHDYSWWLKKFVALDCVIHWSQNWGTHCVFYVTAWQEGSDLVKVGILNLSEDQVRENVRANIKSGFQQVQPYAINQTEVVILGGSPSLNDHIREIRALKDAGAKIVTLNGSYSWALEHGLGPVSEIIVDARPFNARFVDPVDEKNMYLIASQCDPSLTAKLPKSRTFLWHTSAQFIQDLLTEEYGDKPWFPVPGGSTVLLRAIPLLRMLGFWKFHLFGCDSCLKADDHHAYPQPENDGQPVIPVIVSGRIFHCHPWMVAQAQEFIDLIKVLGEIFQLEIYGNGLLSHILNTGAELEASVPLAQEG